MSLLLLRPGEEANITCTRNVGPSPFHGGGAGHELVLPPGALGNVRIRCVRDDGADLDEATNTLNASQGQGQGLGDFGANGMSSVSASEYKAPQRVFVRNGDSNQLGAGQNAAVPTGDSNGNGTASGRQQQKGTLKGKGNGNGTGADGEDGETDGALEDTQAAHDVSGADGVGLLCVPIRGKAKILELLKQNEEDTRKFYDKYKPKPPQRKQTKKDKHHGKHKK